MPNKQSYRPGATNNVTIATTSTAAASGAFGAQTFQIRIAAPATAYFKVDAAPTATSSDSLLPPNRPVHVIVTPGQKISCFSPTIQTISVNEITQ